MKILAVDDESLQLKKLLDALQAVVPDAYIVSSRRPSEALCLAEEEEFDIAFLDVQMRGMSGIELATIIKRTSPNINIIFVTAFDDFKGLAMDVRASGYITKPVNAKKIYTELVHLRFPVPSMNIKEDVPYVIGEHVEVSRAKEIENAMDEAFGQGRKRLLGKGSTQTGQTEQKLRETALIDAGLADAGLEDIGQAEAGGSETGMAGNGQAGTGGSETGTAGNAQEDALSEKGQVETVALEDETILYVQCFGNFDVFDTNHKPVHFPRSKAKEMLAYLIFRRGSRCSNKEIASVLFESSEYTAKLQDSFRHVTSALMKSLRSVDAESVILRDRQNFAIDVTLVDCDYYRFMQEDPLARNEYSGEFMSQYSWAEYVNAYLDSQF